ncbi:hypothetical protein AKJ09_05005 [Labilithrix luteola]|uniref:Uncharacterized protein n=1 Tax=Labilithrix luteola TaxID=1391654 RepID=A0A0K1PY90_9BACT|nr:hypothetical protein AKJ09_05005 [Labilithrix luteola]
MLRSLRIPNAHTSDQHRKAPSCFMGRPPAPAAGREYANPLQNAPSHRRAVRKTTRLRPSPPPAPRARSSLRDGADVSRSLLLGAVVRSGRFGCPSSDDVVPPAAHRPRPRRGVGFLHGGPPGGCRAAALENGR